MYKLIKGLAITGLALATFNVSATTASAHKTHDAYLKTIPKSFRGTWYCKSNLSKINEIKFTKYTFLSWGDHNMVTNHKALYKVEGTTKMSSSSSGHEGRKGYVGPLWAHHLKKSAWYMFAPGFLDQDPDMRLTHAYLRDNNGKKHRFPAVESSYSHLYGKHDGTPKKIFTILKPVHGGH